MTTFNTANTIGGNIVPVTSFSYQDVGIRIDLASGEATATAWGCDLTAEYVSINADYTT